MNRQREAAPTTQQIRHIAVVTPRRDAQSYTAHTDALDLAMRVPNVALYRHAIPDLPYHIARNQLVEGALRMREDMRKANPPAEIEGIVWVDDDVAIPPDTILRLLAHGADFVAGLYISRRQPPVPQMYRIAQGMDGKYWPVLDWPDRQVIEVDAVGFGCCYTSFRVIDAITSAQMDGWGGKWLRLRRKIGGRRGQLPEWFYFDWPHGEDFDFCEKARRLGFSILVDTSIICEHYTTQPVTIDAFRAIRPHLYYVGEDGKPVGKPGEVAVTAIGEGIDGTRRWPDMKRLAKYRKYGPYAGGVAAALLAALAVWRLKR